MTDAGYLALGIIIGILTCYGIKIFAKWLNREDR